MEDGALSHALTSFHNNRPLSKREGNGMAARCTVTIAEDSVGEWIAAVPLSPVVIAWLDTPQMTGDLACDLDLVAEPQLPTQLRLLASSRRACMRTSPGRNAQVDLELGLGAGVEAGRQCLPRERFGVRAGQRHLPRRREQRGAGVALSQPLPQYQFPKPSPNAILGRVRHKEGATALRGRCTPTPPSLTTGIQDPPSTCKGVRTFSE